MTDRPKVRGAEITITDLQLRYPGSDRLVLHNITLHIAAGETLVLLGPSGCGKSSLLRTINRLLAPQSGTVTIDGTQITPENAQTMRRSIGYVIQSGGLFPHLTVAENIGILLREQKIAPAAITARVNELLEVVRLAPKRYAARKPSELSGGEAQRVGIARALAAQPRILLMDEPFGALDPIVRESLQGEIRDLVRDFGTTVLFVTHDVDEAIFMADRIALLREGALIQCGTPFEVLCAPVDLTTAQFLKSADRMRLLRTVRVSACLQANIPPVDMNKPGTTLVAIDEDANLAEAIEMLLRSDGREKLIVRSGTTITGSLDFATISAFANAKTRLHNVI